MKPRVLTKCVANTYTAKDERIIEYSSTDVNAGGLIRFWADTRDGTLHVYVYRHDANVLIHVSPSDDAASRKLPARRLP